MPIRDTVGRDYTVIGWCYNSKLLADEKALACLLREVCSVVGMRPLAEMGVDVEAHLDKLNLQKFEDEGGSSASLILSTSHASIHGWPWRDQSRSDGALFWFTIGSCRDFDPSAIDHVLHERLSVTRSRRTDLVLNLPTDDDRLFTYEIDRQYELPY